MTINNYHAYCDEAGNTGANLIDSNQPLLLVGGWLVNDGVKEIAEQRIREYLKQLSPREEELQGAFLLKRNSRTKGILNLIQDLYSLHCSVICQIIEKRFLLAGHTFDIFLNPHLNPKISYSFDDNWKLKRELIDKIYDLNDDILTEFANAYETLDRAVLLSSLRNITTALSLHLDTDIADLMLGSLSIIDDIIEYQRIGRVEYNSVTLNTPNVASFHMFIHFLEQIGREAEIPKITLIHDEVQQFNDAFRMIFEGFRDDPQNEVIKEGPRSSVFFGFKSLTELKIADSKAEPLLQAADVFISAINRYAVNVYQGKHNAPALLDIARLFFKEPYSYPAIVRIITSNWFEEKLNKSA